MLYKQYYKAMYNVSLHMVKDTYLAEDLMQEAFITAFDKLTTFKNEVSFGAWLKKIVINKCLDYLKSKKVSFESINELASTESEPENDSRQINQKAEIVKEAILELPDGYRTILNLYLLEGYDHEEIGEILGISPSTSRSQYVRAKALLIKNLNSMHGSL